MPYVMGLYCYYNGRLYIILIVIHPELDTEYSMNGIIIYCNSGLLLIRWKQQLPCKPVTGYHLKQVAACKNEHVMYLNKKIMWNLT